MKKNNLHYIQYLSGVISEEQFYKIEEQKVYSEMFDKSDVDLEKRYSLWDMFFNVSNNSVTLDDKGKYWVRDRLGQGDNFEAIGSKLFSILKNEFPITTDIDLTVLRQQIKEISPKAEMLYDAMIRRFAQRLNRFVGNDGNILYTKESAQKNLRKDPSQIAMYKPGMQTRDAEADKLKRLNATRDAFNQLNKYMPPPPDPKS